MVCRARCTSRLGAPDLGLRAWPDAAEVARAATELALLWRDGRGGPADQERARRWHDAASELGFDWSIDGRWRRKSRA